MSRVPKGSAYYIASRNEERFLDNFYGGLAERLRLRRVLAARLPEGVTAQLRTDGESDYVFLMNFKRDEQTVDLGGQAYQDLISGETRSGNLAMPGYGTFVLQRPVAKAS